MGFIVSGKVHASCPFLVSLSRCRTVFELLHQIPAKHVQCYQPERSLHAFRRLFNVVRKAARHLADIAVGTAASSYTLHALDVL